MFDQRDASSSVPVAVAPAVATKRNLLSVTSNAQPIKTFEKNSQCLWSIDGHVRSCACVMPTNKHTWLFVCVHCIPAFLVQRLHDASFICGFTGIFDEISCSLPLNVAQRWRHQNTVNHVRFGVTFKYFGGFGRRSSLKLNTEATMYQSFLTCKVHRKVNWIISLKFEPTEYYMICSSWHGVYHVHSVKCMHDIGCGHVEVWVEWANELTCPQMSARNPLNLWSLPSFWSTQIWHVVLNWVLKFCTLSGQFSSRWPSSSGPVLFVRAYECM